MSPRFREIARWEISYLLRQPAILIYMLIYLAISYLIMVTMGGGLAKLGIVALHPAGVWINSPTSLCGLSGILGTLATPVVAAIAGRAGYRDYESGMYQVFYTLPLSRWEYLGARFIGAFLVCVLLAVLICVGMAVGAAMPFLNQDAIGPFRPEAYLVPLFGLLLPVIFMSAVCFFVVATLTRRPFVVDMAAVVLFAIYIGAGTISTELDHKVLASMIDLSGATSFSQMVEYWPLVQQRTRLVPFTGVFLANRIFWIAIGLATGIWVLLRFRFEYLPRNAYRERHSRRVTSDDIDAQEGSRQPIHLIDERLLLNSRTYMIQLLHLIRWSFRQLIGNRYFIIMTILGGLMTIASLDQLEVYGNSTYPVTYQIVNLIDSFAGVFVLALIAIYIGEIIWSEKSAGMSEVVDATPVPTWVLYLGKITGLFGAIALFQSLMIVVGIGIQVANGYFQFELRQYVLSTLILATLSYMFLASLFLCVQVAARNRYLGYVASALLVVGTDKINNTEILHPLAQFGAGIAFVYSDMNGYGPFVRPLLLWNGYWMGVAALLLVLGFLLWRRGVDVSIRSRYRAAKRRFTPRVQLITIGLIITSSGFAAGILHNIDNHNADETTKQARHKAAEYERKYKKYQDIDQPRITAVRVAIDIFPESQHLRAHGEYTIHNRSNKPIDTLHLEIPEAQKYSVQFSRSTNIVHNDTIQRYFMYRLAEPLVPGDSLMLSFDLDFDESGFRRSGPSTSVVGNGTFVDNSSILPSIGYDPERELQDSKSRKRENLKPLFIRPANDPNVLKQTFFRDADFMDFEATLSTSKDQIAIAPGYLQRTWVRGDRRYFHYRMDAPILNFFAVQSGKYQIRRDKWKNVSIEIYHHPQHAYNVDRMIAGVKASLDYYTTNYGPYQHRQLRIIEFPRYGSFAQSFPNTIPFSEAMGFIAHVKKDDIDYPFYVTAHEVAHQWWAHQVVPANGPGARFVVEGMSQYSALMVMEHVYGKKKIDRFLQYELRHYLLERAQMEHEQPLVNVRDGMIPYTKGGLALYALRGYLGEEKFNATLAKFIAAHKFKGPPYVTTSDLIAAIRAAAPDSIQNRITDLFEKITFYDLIASKATAFKDSNNEYTVQMTLEAKKVYADTSGNDHETPFREWMDVGIYGDTGSGKNIGEGLLASRPVLVKSGLQILTFKIDRLPKRIALDPMVKIINRANQSGSVKVTLSSAVPSQPRP